MDIIIKSFNRPLYLERCLKSIYQYVKGPFVIKVLDDGTPVEYVSKIKELFPEVEFHLSILYDKKIDALKKHVSKQHAFDQYSIPVQLWLTHISQASDFFLLLEDDIWLTDFIDIAKVEQVMKQNQMVMLRLFWQGNNKLIRGNHVQLNKELAELIPSLPYFSEIVFLNKFRVRSVMYKLGVLGDGMRYQLPFYTLYGVAGAFFNRKYWLHLWGNSEDKINETYQLKKALSWYKKNGSRYGKTKNEIAQTSYLTSATNNFTDINFDIILFNHYLNEAWMEGQIDAMDNFPADFNLEQIKPILDKAKDPACSYENWLLWIEHFKQMYRVVGCKVD